jgi:hypothetical protein
MAMTVADDNQSGEAQVFAALDDFRDAVDSDHVVLEVGRIDLEEPANR